MFVCVCFLCVFVCVFLCVCLCVYVECGERDFAKAL